MSILTKVKEKFKILKQLVALPRWWGPVATVAFAIVYHLGSIAFGYSLTAAWLWLFMIIGSISGLRSGLVCAGLIFGYSLYAFPDDLSRVIQAGITSLLAAWIIGTETRALRQALAEALIQKTWAEALAKKLEIALEEAQAGAEAVKAMNSLNGNIIRIKEAKVKVEEVMTLDFLTEGTRKKLGTVIHTLNNLLFATEGWVQLEQLRERQARVTKPIEGTDRPQ